MLCSTMNIKRVGVENREKIPNGDGQIGMLGPALPVKGEMLMDCSVDDHCTLALHVKNDHTLSGIHKALHILGDTWSIGSWSTLTLLERIDTLVLFISTSLIITNTSAKVL